MSATDWLCSQCGEWHSDHKPKEAPPMTEHTGMGLMEDGTDAQRAERLLRGWAKGYREGKREHRFPSDPDGEFFPVDLDYAANVISALALPDPVAGEAINILEAAAQICEANDVPGTAEKIRRVKTFDALKLPAALATERVSNQPNREARDPQLAALRPDLATERVGEQPSGEKAITAGARAIAIVRGHDPDELAPRTAMCGADNSQVPWWMVFEEEAEACLRAAGLLIGNQQSLPEMTYGPTALCRHGWLKADCKICSHDGSKT